MPQNSLDEMRVQYRVGAVLAGADDDVVLAGGQHSEELQRQLRRLL